MDHVHTVHTRIISCVSQSIHTNVVTHGNTHGDAQRYNVLFRQIIQKLCNSIQVQTMVFLKTQFQAAVRYFNQEEPVTCNQIS